jgi:hypothetical protein
VHTFDVDGVGPVVSGITVSGKQCQGKAHRGAGCSNRYIWSLEKNQCEKRGCGKGNLT